VQQLDDSERELFLKCFSEILLQGPPTETLQTGKVIWIERYNRVELEGS
jgi:hypothetical protein